MSGRSGPAQEAKDWQLLEGDALELLTTLPAWSVDCVITDPPYGIGIKGEPWDGRLIRGTSVGREAGERYAEWTRLWARECLRLLKPGGYLLAFGAPRTAHRLAAGLEEPGLELRDQLLWLYGSGLPKSSLHAGRGTSLKPCYEPILLARAPLDGTLARTDAHWGTGRLGIDDGRIETSGGALGRWPGNLALSHTIDCARPACEASCPVRLLDDARPSSPPSRFFYCPKPSRLERDAGCGALPAKTVRIYGKGGDKPRRNIHPTVKPQALMRWLVRLASPPGGRVLDPFAGSGSTGVAALEEGRCFLGIERDADYSRIARARLRHAESGERVTRAA
jgi:DNA modification methylase